MSTASNRTVLLFGPTAVGKTATLERLARDDRLRKRPVVVVSADSVQAYRGLDIGSAKPGPAELAALPHELIDILDPDQPFSVGDFLRMADDACGRSIARGALPIVSGGAAYYLRAFIYGSPPAPPADLSVRSAVQAELAERGLSALRRELELVDPASAARIAPADAYRTARALEVFRCSGKPLSSFVPPSEPRRRWDILALGLDRPRPELYARIDARVDAMLKAGLEAEVRSLVAAGYGPLAPGMRAIGYAEFLAGEGDVSRVADLIKLHTRRYAKRQLTFMRSLPGVRWFAADDYEGLAAALFDWLA